MRTSRVTRRGLLALAAAGGLALAAGCKPLSLKWRGSESKKPVLYLYPQQETALEVSLAWDGELTYAYPEPVRTRGLATWSVTASPDGTLRDSAGRTYPSLFWEGTSSPAFTQAEGFVVEPGGETVFLEEKLALLGLSERESADFITYWGPRMRTRGRCLVTFATDQYARRARYTFVGNGAAMVPDTFVRVYVVIGAVPREDVPEQVLIPAPTRHGFTAVEWGGTEQ